MATFGPHKPKLRVRIPLAQQGNCFFDMKHELEELNFKPSLRQRQKRRDKRLHEEVIECRRGLGGDGHRKSREKGSRKAAQRDSLEDRYALRENIRYLAKIGNSTSPEDNLEPLKRWLCAQAGRPWAEVYAKLGGIARPDSMHGTHIRQHLWDFVYKSTWLDAEGKIVVANKWGSIVYPAENARKTWVGNRYFVHPVSGILQKMSDLTAPNTPQTYPKKARFKLEKEKNRWKIKQGVVQEKKEKPGLDLSKYRQIRTRNKRLSPGMLLDIRCQENVFRAKVEDVVQRKGSVRRTMEGRPRWVYGDLVELHILVTDCHAGLVFGIGKTYRLEIFNGEATDWTVFDAWRLF